MARQRRWTLATIGVACVAVVVAAIPSAAGAQAATTSSGAGAVTQYGTVVFVDDGDTIDVRIDGVVPDPGRDGTRIRFLGTQAMELYTYHHDLNLVSGECHGVDAAKRLKSLLMSSAGVGKRVRLTARDASSSNLGRPARFVAVKGKDGAWHDVGAVMIREGQAIASYQKVEYAWNASYRQLSETAAAKGIGLWDSSFCGPGPSARLSVRVNWDAPGNDASDVNGEYVKVTNTAAAAVNLAGWWVRDSATRKSATLAETRRGFIFPSGAVIAPGASLLVHVGKGTNSPATGQFYYGLGSPIFENVTTAPSHLGDGAYLFDPRGNLRGWQQYPCVSTLPHACTS
jgi:micrococcal nuclease